MTKVLVLGGAGFVGLALVDALRTRPDCEIVAVDNLARGLMDEDARAILTDESVTFINADLCDPASFQQFGGDFDDIYLLAGVVGVKYTVEQPDRVLEVSARIILNTLDWWRRVGRGRLLYSSSSEVYSGGQDVLSPFPLPTSEDVPIVITDISNVRFSYAAVKTFGEASVHAFAQRHGLAASIVRYHNVYGPRMGYEHVVPELSLRLRRQEDPFVLYGAEQTRAFCYISDAVRGTIAAMDEAAVQPTTFHIGNGAEETVIKDLYQHLCDVSGFKPTMVNMVDAPKGSPTRRCPDTTRMETQLGVTCEVDLADGLGRTYDWYISRHPDGQKPAGR